MEDWVRVSVVLKLRCSASANQKYIVLYVKVAYYLCLDPCLLSLKGAKTILSDILSLVDILTVTVTH